jgi:hypothetical protein
MLAEATKQHPKEERVPLLVKMHLPEEMLIQSILIQKKMKTIILMMEIFAKRKMCSNRVPVFLPKFMGPVIQKEILSLVLYQRVQIRARVLRNDFSKPSCLHH